MNLQQIKNMSLMVHHLQTERGAVCLFLCEPNDTNQQILDAALKNSQHTLKLLKSFFLADNSDDISLYVKKFVDVIEGFKKEFDFKRMLPESNPGELMMAYTHQMITRLIYLIVEVCLHFKADKSVEITALNNFINWKERIARERSLGVMGFALEGFDSAVFLNDFEVLLSEQQINKRTFLALACENQQDLFNKHYVEQMEIESVHKQMSQKHTPDLTATFWFNLVSKKVNMLFNLESKLFQLLFDTSKNELNEVTTQLFEQQELKSIEDYLLFRNLSDDIKAKLFQSSNVKAYKKGSLLFLDGELASRIYVVISGWVKIFKNSADGEEKIENMLTSGDVVIESSIFDSSNYQNSAQVNSEAKLLSFPAAIYRNLVNKDLTLALNSLKYLSQSSTQYQQQVEANRIKTTKERVGHFLLKQFVAQKNPNTIMLPYEKTIIASLLDMKPETFSRSLKSFKQEGLASEKQQIQVRNMKMLCGYCDKEIAQSCQFKKQHDCQFNETTDQLPTDPRNIYKSCS